jgi:hypothetical protein
MSGLRYRERIQPGMAHQFEGRGMTHPIDFLFLAYSAIGVGGVIMLIIIRIFKL